MLASPLLGAIVLGHEGFETMIPSVLVLSIAAGIAAGIVWADIGHRLPTSLVVPWLLFAGTLICMLLSRIRQAASSRIDCFIGSGPLRVSGLLCTAGLAFFVGFDGLDLELSRARSDSQRAERVSREAVRVAEARVASRRAGRFGDEVKLAFVRAVDGGTVLPKRLILRLGEGAPGRVGVLPSRAERLLWPGAWVRVGLYVAPLRPSRNPGTRDRERHLARRGVAARARLVKPDWVLSLSSGVLDQRGLMGRVSRARATWRERVATRLESEGRAGALASALGIGDRSGIQRETREAFRRLGLAHLLAVSGLHVGFVAGLAGWTFLRASSWLCRRGRNTLPFDWSLGAACGAAALYAWVTGAGVSVERATLLFGLFAVCRLCLRIIDPSVALSWVAVVILLMDPAALFDVGAQLSFGACAALIIAGFWKGGLSPEPASKRGSGLGIRISRAASQTFRVSLAVSLGTAPLLAQHGMSLSVLSPVINVVAIPWLGFLVLPTSLLAIFLADVLPSTVFSLLMFPARGFEACVVRAAIHLPEPSARALLELPVLVLLITIGLFWLCRGEWKKAVLVWIGVSLAGSAPSPHHTFSANTPRVVFFDVGQGDAALVQGPEAVLLIDTGRGPPDGSGGTVLVRGLRAMGVNSIDVLVVTHADLDHRGGASRVLGAFPVRELWLPVSGIEDAPLQALSKTAAERGTQVRWLAAGALGTDRGGLEIEVLWPPPGSSWQGSSRNERSLVLRVIVDEITFLFTADIGEDSEKELMVRPGSLMADVLKVAHHGSRWSSSTAFLEVVSAPVVVVSAPCDSTRGLPNLAVLERLDQLSAALWWTGRDGAVMVSRGGAGNLDVRSWGQARRCGPQ